MFIPFLRRTEDMCLRSIEPLRRIPAPEDEDRTNEDAQNNRDEEQVTQERVLVDQLADWGLGRESKNQNCADET